jgi:hypothetical protein
VNQRGQVFSLDMLFALTLTALIVSYSGLALGQARRQAEEYQLRFSLERIANDAADALMRTAGIPENWEENILVLETPGLAEVNRSGSLRNMLSVIKLGWLRHLCRSSSWVDPRNENAVMALKALFGGSEHFEINLYGENGERMWSIWPGWDVAGASSGSGAGTS